MINMILVRRVTFALVISGYILTECGNSVAVKSESKDLISSLSSNDSEIDWNGSSISNVTEKNETRGRISDLGNVTMDDDYDLIFEEKRREDGYNRTTPEEDPHSVLLVMQYPNGKDAVCTGTLLTPVWVLTAAHCVEKSARVIIYAGGDSIEELKSKRTRPGSQIQTSTEYHVHPKYQEKSFNYDIAVVKTMEEFNMTNTVNTMELSVEPWTYKSYKRCRFTGFGMVNFDQPHSEDKTRKTHLLNIKWPCLCSFKLRMLLGRTVTDTYLCTQPMKDYGVCSGDSGGGLVCDGRLRGVAMQIIQLLNTRTCDMSVFNSEVQCAVPSTLSVFQNTCYFVRWINSHVGLYDESLISDQCREPRSAAVACPRPLPTTLLLLLLLTVLTTRLCTVLQ